MSAWNAHARLPASEAPAPMSFSTRLLKHCMLPPPVHGIEVIVMRKLLKPIMDMIGLLSLWSI